MDNLAMLALLRSIQQQVNSVQKGQGPAGADGAEGPQGIQGPKGEQGDAGPRGADGAAGPSGADGADGADGEAGVGVESVSQAADGDLVFHLTDGTEHVVEFPTGLLRGSEDTYILQNNGSSGEGGTAIGFDRNVDGGASASVYLTEQLIDGGNA